MSNTKHDPMCFRCGSSKDLKLDYRPSYINSDGEGDCIGRVLSCPKCSSLTDRGWIRRPKRKLSNAEKFITEIKE